jgi:two-component system CheB/CheR fusion protein
LARRGVRRPDFPIIGIGASAGGLEAFEQFFQKTPADSGMAFVLVQHLDPDHASLLTSILQRSTTMPVIEVRDGMAVKADHVYVIPPNREIALLRGTLRLDLPDRPRGMRTSVDFFFRSLATELGERAIGIVLSGTGADGTLGLRAIHGAGGVSFVQDPASAQYNGMPLSAIGSGAASYVLPPAEMPARLRAYVDTLFRRTARPVPVPASGRAAGVLHRIVAILRARTGHDFALYKQSTIARRIERRMAVHSLDDLDGYVRYLQENPEEPQILFKEMLINVTSFFRDPDAFEALAAALAHRLFGARSEPAEVRVWIPACSTGEEAYSIAILLREAMDKRKQELKVQIYATASSRRASRGTCRPSGSAGSSSRKTTAIGSARRSAKWSSSRSMT